MHVYIHLHTCTYIRGAQRPAAQVLLHTCMIFFFWTALSPPAAEIPSALPTRHMSSIHNPILNVPYYAMCCITLSQRGNF